MSAIASTTSSMPLVFGKYQVIRRLAVGGMGEIFLARQTGVAGFDRLVILKSLLPELAEQPGFIDLFLDEARVAATLNHPNIVSIYEVGEWGGIYFIAMEYIRGDNLGRLLQAATRAGLDMPLIVPTRIVHDAALALDHAHHATDTNGRPLTIVHRDIGPQNIMVRSDGVSKVVDFGIARAANRSTRTRTGTVRGKLQYMSPEQIADKPLDGRSDQFSLGIVLWEMSTQGRLFKAENEVVSIRKIMRDPIPLPSSVRPDYPRDLEAVVMRMLEREPARRYARCEDVAADLAKIMERLGGTGADGQKTVAEFVDEALGEKLADATKDLTPTAQTPFSSAMGLTGLRGDLSSGAERGGPMSPLRGWLSRHRRGFVGGASVLALSLAGLVMAALLGKLSFALPGFSEPGPTIELQEPVGARVRIGELQWPEQVPTVVHGLTPGEHVLRLELPELPPIIRRVHLSREDRVVVSEPRPASGMVLDVREPPGARVVVDGVRWPEPVPTVVTGLREGPHVVRLELSDGRAIERKLRLHVGTPILMQDAPPASGMVLDVRDPVGATVIIDGMAWHEPAPTVVTGLAVGAHEVRLQQPGKPAIERNVVLRVGEPIIISEPPVADGTVIDIRDPAGARVVIDGAPWGEPVPTVVTGLTPGPHEVRLELEGKPAIVKQLRLEVGQPILVQERAPPEKSTLLVKSRPSGAAVTLAGRSVGKTPARLTTLEPEVEHVLVIEKRGYAPMTLTLSLVPGERREEVVALEPESKAAPKQKAAPAPLVIIQKEAREANGFLTLNTTPWVKVAIDGKPFGSTPLYKQELPPGAHELHLVNEEFGIDVKQSVVIAPGKTLKVDLKLK